MNDPYSRFSSCTTADYSAEQAFTEAVHFYTHQSRKDPKEAKVLDGIQASSISDVVSAVIKARECYEKKRSDSRVKNCLVEVSRRLVYYGNVMDVMVQHHPEYVSLAWGTMKLLCGAIVENEKLGMTIVTGLCEVADALPRTELFLALYPTETMKGAVTTIYTWILQFLTRSLKWYGEGKIRHAFNAVMKPAALQYDDIISGIRQSCHLMSNHASANSLAEQRDMHEKLRALQNGTAVALPSIQAQQQETQITVSTFRDSALSALSNVEKRQDQVSKDLASLTLMIQQLRENMISDQAVNADARIQLRNKMTEIQLTQALGIVSSSLSLDHMANLQQSIQLRDRRRGKWDQYAMVFQRASSFKKWNTAASSASISLKSTFKDRNLLSGSLTLIIEYLRQPRIAVLWALKCRTRAYDATEILKSMIHQALTLDFVSHTDVMFSFELRRYLDARSDEDYVNLLGELLSHFKLVYIIVQVEAMLPDAACRFRRYLDNLLDGLETRVPGATLKILVASSGPSASPQQSSDRQVLRIGGKKQQKSYRTYGVPVASSKPQRFCDDGTDD